MLPTKRKTHVVPTCAGQVERSACTYDERLEQVDDDKEEIDSR